MEEPMLPPMSERLDIVGVKRLCMSVLAKTVKDATSPKWRNNALWFAKSEMAITICEVYEINYESFLKKVEENYKGVKCGKKYHHVHC